MSDDFPSPMRMAAEVLDGLGLHIHGEQIETEPPIMRFRVEICDIAAGEGNTPKQAAERLRLALQVLQHRKQIDEGGS